MVTAQRCRAKVNLLRLANMQHQTSESAALQDVLGLQAFFLMEEKVLRVVSLCFRIRSVNRTYGSEAFLLYVLETLLDFH